MTTQKYPKYGIIYNIWFTWQYFASD